MGVIITEMILQIINIRHRVHSPKVTSSNTAPATKLSRGYSVSRNPIFLKRTVSGGRNGRVFWTPTGTTTLQDNRNAKIGVPQLACETPKTTLSLPLPAANRLVYPLVIQAA